MAAQLLLYSDSVGSLSWKSLLSEMMAFLYISRTTSQRKLPVDAKKKIGSCQFLPSSLCSYCSNLVIYRLGCLRSFLTAAGWWTGWNVILFILSDDLKWSG